MTDQVVLVTGASRGIGAACAYKFGALGYKVAVHYRSQPEEAAAICREIPRAVPFQYDLADEAACQSLIKAVQAEFGRIDVLVNNAGISVDQVLPFAKPDDFNLLINSNLRSVFLLAKFVSRLMIKQKQGSIINLTSVVGHTGNAGQSMYAATKSGITGFTKSIAQDLAPYGIRCNCVAPGFIETAMTDKLPEAVRSAILAKIPLRRMGTTAEVADAVAYLAGATYVTGTTLHINGGMYTT